MPSKPFKWLIGCGAFGGLLIIIAILVGLFMMKDTIRAVKRTVDDLKEFAEIHDELVAAYGEVDEYVPPIDGIPPANRLSRFLSLRDGLSEARGSLQDKLAVFPPAEVFDDEGETLGKVAGVLKGLGGLVPDATGYMLQRTRLMRDLEMSPGEYLYIYSLAYYSWLGYSPEDGPQAMELDSDGVRYPSGERMLDGDEGTFSSGEVWERYHRYMLAQLRNQLAAALEGETSDVWRGELRREYLTFKDDTRRVPWEDGMPAAMAEALAPFRDRLEASYSADINCFELAPMKREDWDDQNRRIEITSD
jgi:hypothetical protein